MVTQIADPKGLRGLSDPTRREIVRMLSHRQLAVQEIARHFEMSRPAISRHLRVLRECGLVVEQKIGRHRLYELRAMPLAEIGGWLEALLDGEGVRREEPAEQRGDSPPDERIEPSPQDESWRAW